MRRVTIVRRDWNWNPLYSNGDYASFRYEAELINVLRVDGKWIGIVVWCDGSGITEVDMTEVEQWHLFDESNNNPPGW